MMWGNFKGGLLAKFTLCMVLGFFGLKAVEVL